MGVIDPFRSGFSKIDAYVQNGFHPSGKPKYMKKTIKRISVDNVSEIAEMLTDRIGEKNVVVKDI